MHQVQVLVFWVRQVVGFEGPEGRHVVTCYRDGSLGDVVVGADGVDTQNCGVVAGQFSPKGVPLLERAWNLGMAEESVLVVRTLNYTGRGATGNMKRSIIDRYCKALSNGIRKAVPIVINRGMPNSPVG